MVLYLVVSPSLLVSLAAFLQFSAKKSSLLTPAESTLTDVYQNKSLKPPLESTLTQKRGWGMIMVNQHPARSAGPDRPSGAEGPLFHRGEGRASRATIYPERSRGIGSRGVFPRTIRWPFCNDRVLATERPVVSHPLGRGVILTRVSAY